MFDIFLGLTPFISITLIGFFFGKSKVFDLQKAKIFNLFSFYVAIPALIIKLIAQSNISEIDISQMSSYLLMQLSCGFFAFLLTNRIFKRPTQESVIWSLTVALSNHVILVLPVSEIFFGRNTITQISNIILMDSVVIISIVSFFLELTAKKKNKLFDFLKSLILNPLILSIFIGLFIKILNVNINESPFEYILIKLSACAMPVGLFAIGIILSYYSDKIFNKLTITISVLKLIISPVVLLIFSSTLFNISNPVNISGALMVSVGPCGASAIFMCSAYNISPKNFIKAILISTFASIFTFLFTINLLN